MCVCVCVCVNTAWTGEHRLLVTVHAPIKETIHVATSNSFLVLVYILGKR